MKKRVESAADLGKPVFLAKTSETKGQIRPDDSWAIDWNVSCKCGGTSLIVYDYFGEQDKVDTPFWIGCSSCDKIVVAYQPGEDCSDLEFDPECTCKVECSKCRGTAWPRLAVGLFYLDDLVDEAIELGEGIELLKDSFWWLNLDAICECGHQCQLAAIRIK